ncbi:hypothetical protein [Rhodococcus sp. Q1]|uniref:hypothetical protein n=2 Tax=Rhodococcus TaxID=1827 RepID=UPI00101F031A|nr:hypothetical protein [Rhodococcus sp. Q1]
MHTRTRLRGHLMPGEILGRAAQQHFTRPGGHEALNTDETARAAACRRRTETPTLPATGQTPAAENSSGSTR